MAKTLTHRQFRALGWYAAGRQGFNPSSDFTDEALLERGYIKKIYTDHYRITEKGRDAFHRDRRWRWLLDRVQRKIH